MLRAAREKAGLSREEAAHRVYVGNRTLASYELGETIAPPDVIMRMAEVYSEPALLADYCPTVCPIGQVLAHSFNRSGFAVAVMRVLKEFADVEELRGDLIKIAADGRINQHEVEEFITIMRELVELEKWIGELKFFALRHGIEIDEIMPETA